MKDYDEHLVKKRVTYTLEIDGKFYVVENVPARVNEETGEQYFAPSTVEQLRKRIMGQEKPDKVIETPVYTFDDKDV
ncbi:MAG: YgiT-type zinc finger protein [Bacteroidetes bacterium]|nr:YgiT-type zinc finger protein [Bacteroidota bacterium]